VNGAILSVIFWASLAFSIWVGVRIWGAR
jgi:hypothetical protein